MKTKTYIFNECERFTQNKIKEIRIESSTLMEAKIKAREIVGIKSKNLLIFTDIDYK